MPITTTITKEGTRAVSPVGGGDELLTSLSLKGTTDLSAQIIDAVTDGDIELTIEGASTISVTVHDPGPEYALLNSGVYAQPEGPIVMELPSDDPEEEALRFVLTHVEKNDDDSILTFEDEIVYWLGQYDKPVKAARDMVTRAQFIMARVSEVTEITIPFFCPEIDVKQPIAKTPHKTRTTTTREKDVKRGGGFHSNSKITVKHSGANATQIRNIEKVLDVCSSHSAPTDVLVMAVMTITQESNAGTNMDRGGAAGLFSKLSNTKGIESDTNDWLTGGTDFQGGGALASYKKNHGKHTLGWICTDVQRDYTWNTSGQGKDFQQWRDEAQRTVRLYGGGSDSGSTTTRTSQREKRYEFSRGRPGGPKGENTWGMGLRLAEEVKWRFFVAIGVLYLISEPELLSSRTRLTVGPETDGIENVDFGWNVASKKDIPPSEITITARADRWGVPPGAVIELEGYGPANGWWLISSIRRGLFDPTCEITCKQPSNPRDEPAPETVQSSTSSRGGSDSSDGRTVPGRTARLHSDGTAIPPEDAPEAIKAVIRAANAIHTKPYRYGGGHGGFHDSAYDCSGAVSFALHGGGLISAPQPSGYFIDSWGKDGGGQWLTTYANAGHMFMICCGLEFDTSHSGANVHPGGSGPRWLIPAHTKSGFKARHHEGL